jgi:hypothetical protein
MTSDERLRHRAEQIFAMRQQDSGKDQLQVIWQFAWMKTKGLYVEFVRINKRIEVDGRMVWKLHDYVEGDHVSEYPIHEQDWLDAVEEFSGG